MLRYLILCRSLTYAQKAAAVLERRGIDAPIIKAPLRLRERGCGYALSVTPPVPGGRLAAEGAASADGSALQPNGGRGIPGGDGI